MRNVYKFHFLKQCLDYNPDTGELTWKHRDKWMFPSDRGWKIFNTRFAGKVACAHHNAGYIHINSIIYGHHYKVLAHRLAWYIHTGFVPDKEIDHINGNKKDNRISNLRLVTPAENQKNRALQRNNKSGYSGVSWNKKASKWAAVIKVNRNKVFLGWFQNKEDAIAVRKQAEREYGFHENHGRAA